MASGDDERLALLPEFVSSKELRAEFGVGQGSIQGWCNKGLPYYRIGRGRWFLLDELRTFMCQVLRRPKLPGTDAFDA